MLRYEVGFSSEAMRCGLMERNPGYFPIVYGDAVCIAIVEDKEIAEHICHLLNTHPLRRGI